MPLIIYKFVLMKMKVLDKPSLAYKYNRLCYKNSVAQSY